MSHETECVEAMFGKEAAEIFEMINGEGRAITPEIVKKAQDMGDDRPDWVGIIAGAVFTNDIHNAQNLEYVKDLALSTLWYDINYAEPKQAEFNFESHEKGSVYVLAGGFFGVIALVLIFFAFWLIAMMNAKQSGFELGDSAQHIFAASSASSAASLAIAGEAFSADKAVSHAITRHGAEAVSAYSCFSSHSKPAGTWYNKKTKTTANICVDGPNFFVQIIDELGREITAFQRKNAKTLGDVGSYLKAQGYTK